MRKPARLADWDCPGTGLLLSRRKEPKATADLNIQLRTLVFPTEQEIKSFPSRLEIDDKYNMISVTASLILSIA